MESPARRYLIVQAMNDPGTLMKHVNRLIQEGWQPLGGVSVAPLTVEGYGQNVFHQAMVSPLNEDPYWMREPDWIREHR